MFKKSLSRDDILKADDIVIEEVKVPEWGGFVYIKTMSGLERDAFEASLVNPAAMAAKGGKAQSPAFSKSSMKNIRAKLLARCMCDKDGKLLFEEKDIIALGQKSASGLSKCFDVASRLSGITEQDVEELAEQLDADPSVSSHSD